MNKHGDAVPDALPLRLKAKIETITDVCLLKAGNQYPEFKAWQTTDPEVAEAVKLVRSL
jgi:hypothetical protein